MATVVHDFAAALELRARILALLHAKPRDLIDLQQHLDYPLPLLQGALRVLANSGHIERRNARWELATDEASGNGPSAA